MTSRRLTSRLALIAVGALTLSACGGDAAANSDAIQQTIESLVEQARDGVADDEDKEDLKENVQNMVEGMGTGGTGTVTVNGATWSVDATLCLVDDEAFKAQGVATGPGGEVAWFELDRSVTTRAEAATYMDPATLNMLFPSGADFIEEALVELQIGFSDMFSQSSASPRWAMESANIALPIPNYGQLDFQINGQTFQGTGQAENIADDDGYGETSPMTVEVTCK